MRELLNQTIRCDHCGCNSFEIIKCTTIKKFGDRYVRQLERTIYSCLNCRTKLNLTVEEGEN